MWEFLMGIAKNSVVLTADNGEVYAVDLTDPVGFTAYLGIAFVLYAIRETKVIPIRFMPLVAVVLGLLYAVFVEYGAFNEASVVAGLRLALTGIGSVATIKYIIAPPDQKTTNSNE